MEPSTHAPAPRPQPRRHSSGLNRAARRALAKARTCLNRKTKIPPGVAQKVATQSPDLLSRLADQNGMRIGAGGWVLPKAPSDGTDSSAADGASTSTETV